MPRNPIAAKEVLEIQGLDQQIRRRRTRYEKTTHVVEIDGEEEVRDRDVIVVFGFPVQFAEKDEATKRAINAAIV